MPRDNDSWTVTLLPAANESCRNTMTLQSGALTLTPIAQCILPSADSGRAFRCHRSDAESDCALHDMTDKSHWRMQVMLAVALLRSADTNMSLLTLMDDWNDNDQ